jgi:hypothetical protein
MSLGRVQRNQDVQGQSWNGNTNNDGEAAPAPRMPKQLPFQQSRFVGANSEIDGAGSGRKTGKVDLAPKNMSPQQKYDYYAKIVKQHGGTIDSTKPTVLGLRGLSADGSHHTSKVTKKADETFVVLDPKTHTARELPGTTHPAQSTYSGRPTGFLKPGNYETERHHNHNGDISWHVTTKDGNGTVPATRAGKDSTMTAVLFHRPKNQQEVTSAGCQVLKNGAAWESFKKGMPASGFHYTLVDANGG